MKVLLLSGMGIVWPTANAYNDNDMLEDTFLDYRLPPKLIFMCCILNSNNISTK